MISEKGILEKLSIFGAKSSEKNIIAGQALFINMFLRHGYLRMAAGFMHFFGVNLCTKRKATELACAKSPNFSGREAI